MATAVIDAPAAPPTPRMTSRQRLVLTLLLGSQFMLAVDFSILNVALPDIGHGLGFSLSNLQWISTAMMLPSAGFALLFGRFADMAGRRKMLLIGMALLAAGSLVGGLATTPAILLVGRVAQGLACALATPAALSLLTTSLPEGPLRDKALALNGTLLSAGFTVGAIFGGILTDLLSWRWAFFINVPVAVAILFAAPGVISESRGERTKLDIPGAITVTGGLLALVYGVTAGGQDGWAAPVTLITLAAAVVLLGAFWFIELRAKAPLASVRVLTRQTVKWGNFGGLITFTMQSSAIFLLTLYLQDVFGYTPLQTGLTFCGFGAAAFTGGLLAPRLLGRFGNRTLLGAGLLVQAVATGALFLVGNGGGSALALLLAATMASGVGHVSVIVAYMVTATSGLSDSEQGLASGLASMTQQVGATLGIPVLSSIATARTAATGSALEGIHLALLVNASIVLVGAVLSYTGLRTRR
ncbi:MFS transporter [Streptomyces alanosinicus]|uniref:MFS transporter n=1 Tax=Streptomyces alanosinicus TaxID=68171 RepID=A0A918YQD6_9ACTN|nr:MFS transporter [Streptomyces alanosinicus]GHE12642.1 MFS transporter [Streptomyces alanosinicus]